MLGLLLVNGSKRPYDYTSRRFAECAAQDVYLDDLVLEISSSKRLCFLGK